MNSSAPDTGSTIDLNNRLTGLGERLLRFAMGKSALTLFDQIIFSGTNFVVTILLGRWAGPESLGVYALIFTVTIMALTFHESLICLPYAIEFRKLPKRARSAYAGSTLVQSSIMALIATPILMIAGLTAWLTPVAGTSLGSALCIFALTAPFVIARDFARRYSLAHLRPHIAVIVDGSVSVLQISMLVALALSGKLSAWTALIVIGVGCAMVSAIWLIAMRPEFNFHRRRYRHDFNRNWKLGRWVFSSQACSVINVFAPHWLIAGMLGTSATGIYVGATAVVLLSNPFILGVHNMLSPKLSHRLASDGKSGTGRVVMESTLFLAATMVVFCVVIAIFGDQLTTGIYGETFTGNNLTTFVYALSTFCSATGMPTDRALWATNHPKVSFYTGLVGLIVTIGVTLIALPAWGIVGGAFGLMTGNLSATLLRWLAYVQLGVSKEVADD